MHGSEGLTRSKKEWFPQWCVPSAKKAMILSKPSQESVKTQKLYAACMINQMRSRETMGDKYNCSDLSLEALNIRVLH